MDLKQLQYFTTIVEEGSITAASRKLFMSQPPLSNQIKLLEAELNCTLFERGSRSIHLTQAGQTLYNYAISMLQLNEVAKQETMIAAKKHDYTVRIGIVSSVICSDAIKWIHDFSKMYPETHFEIIEGNTYDLLQKFHNEIIHLAILRTPFNTEGLTCHKLFSDSLVAIGNSSFLDPNTQVSLKYLSTQPLILYRRWEDIIRSHFTNQNLDMNCCCINDDARTTFYCVEEGMGIGLVPHSAVSLIKTSDIIHTPITDCDITSDVVVAYNSVNYLPSYSNKFIEYITSVYNNNI